MNGRNEEFLFGRLSTGVGRVEEARRSALGFYDLSIMEPLDPKPGEAIRLHFRCGVDFGLERLLVFWTVGDRAPTWTREGQPTGSTLCSPAQKASVFWDTLCWGYVQDWVAELPPQQEGILLQYVVAGFDAEGKLRTFPLRMESHGDHIPQCDTERHGSPQIFTVGIDRLRPPDWFREAVIYQVLVDRFAPDPGKAFSEKKALNSRLGGTLRGIAAHLDGLRELGIDTLWLTPIFASPDYHGYATSDFLTVEPSFGGESAWAILIQAAHRRGMRVILDFVANHVSDRHPTFIAAVRDPEAPTRSWFRFRHWPRDYACFFNVVSQPELDAEQPEVRDHLIAAARHWLDRGCDGFRLDYALGLSHGFWSRFRAATRQAAPESVCFGEITHAPPVLRSYSGRFDGCLDFTLCEGLRGVFARKDLSLSDFDRQIRRHFAYFGEELVLPSFLDNHDMNRFLWLCGGDRRCLKLAALVQFLLPGPPVIYYGTEIGLSQNRGCGCLEEARLPFPDTGAWDLGLRDFYRDLIYLRRCLQPWLFRPELIHMDVKADWASWRVGPALLVVNRGERRSIATQGDSVLLASDPGVAYTARQKRLRLPAWSGAVLSLSKD